MARRGGLGRGLDALIPPHTNEGDESAFRELPVSAITANRRQPRTRFDEEALGALTASVRELGVLQPVLVRATGGDNYELIAGERRWRAARRAGLATIPAIVRMADDTSSLEQALVENVQREDLSPMDEAAAYQQLIEDFNLTHDELAARVGKSRAAISNTLRLFQLPPAVQRLLADGQLTAGHARALLSTPDRTFQEGLARRTVTEGLSVRAVEEAARHHGDAAPGPAIRAVGTTGSSGLRPPGLLELEELLADRLDTRVKVDMRGGKGRVVIEFADLEDLERIYRAMTGRRDQAAAT
ncbi:MAG: ParB/RepB/Spo0J family partition protein [Actinobacteria bacterium]|nr:ParB/RepB/Spo0J family partition protein [Actinomycetota bacterium]